MPGLTEMYANFPAELRELFDLEAMTTGLGFLNAELYTLLLPALFIVYGVGRGARLVAGEEEDGTLDLLLVTPVSAARIVAEKAVGGYVLYAAGLLVSSLEPWQPLSPFHQALQGGPLGAGLPLSYLWLLLGSAVLIAAALPVLDRRDIAAHN